MWCVCGVRVCVHAWRRTYTQITTHIWYVYRKVALQKLMAHTYSARICNLYTYTVYMYTCVGSILQMSYVYLPSGKYLHDYGLNHHFRWVNSPFPWQFSIAHCWSLPEGTMIHPTYYLYSSNIPYYPIYTINGHVP